MHPVAQRLPVHAAGGGGFRAALAVEDRRQRQQAPALVGVFALADQTPKLRG